MCDLYVTICDKAFKHGSQWPLILQLRMSSNNILDYLEVMMGGPKNVCKDLIEIKIVTSTLLDFIIFSLSGNELVASHELSHCAWIRATDSTAWLRVEQTMMAELQKLSQS